MNPVIESLRGGLIVSCQAGEADAIYGPSGMADMALAAARGGAIGIRANGAADIAAIRAAVALPIIGIFKRDWNGLGIRITPTFAEAQAIAAAGSAILAIDGTGRAESEGRGPLAAFIARIHDELHLPVMADVSTFEEGLAAAEAGADIVASTLSGYTPYSPALEGPDFELVRRLSEALSIPVIAEGRIAVPGDARRMIENGAFAVVVGTMITRPRGIVEKFVAALRPRREATVAALDIGGTKIAAGVVRGSIESLAYSETTPTAAHEGGAAVLARVSRLIATMIAECPEIEGIGISTAGEPDAAGSIRFATDAMPGWQGIDLAAQLEARYKLPVVVENDGQAATIGEALYGAGRGHSHVLGVTVGTGIGGGFAIEGQVYSGATRASLSVGHILVMRDGRRCPCGRLGCLEAYASGPALALEYRARHEARVGKPPLPDGEAHSGDAVWHAAQAGDADAIAAIRACGAWLGYGLATAYNLFNPSVTVVGGGVAQIGDLFLDAARESLALHAYPTVRQAPIVAAALGTRAGLIGASALIRARLNRSS